MGFFRKHTGRASYDLFSNHTYYVPGYGGMMILFVMFLIGSLLGSLLVGSLALFSSEFANIYGTVIAYPVMFIPAWLYVSAKSRRNEFFDTGYALDSENFGQLGGFKLALTVSVATIAAAFIGDAFNTIMPPTPEWFEDAMAKVMDAPIWITLISVSIFAPLFEEWLCRGLVLRGLLQKTHPVSAIFVSAAFFAVLHMNPWQALAAFLLGILFGFVYYKTGSLKLTMLMHCVNNTMAVILSKIPAFEEVENFADVLSPWAYAGIMIASIAFIAAACVVLRNIPFTKEGAKSNCDEVPPVTI